MNHAQRFLAGVVSGAGSVVLKTALNILLIPVFIGMLGLEQYGLFVLANSLVELAWLLDFGFSSTLVQALGTSSEQQDRATNPQELLKMGQWLFGGMALLVLIIGLPLTPWGLAQLHMNVDLHGIAQTALALALAEAALTVYYAYYRAVLLAHCLVQWTNLADAGFFFFTSVIGLGLLMAGFGLVELLALRVIASVLRLAFLISQTLKVEPHALFPHAHVRLGTFTRLLKMSAHSMAVNFSIILSHKIDTLIIARFLPISVVGIFEIVFRFLSVTLQIGFKICEGAFPVFTRKLAQNAQSEIRTFFLSVSGLAHFVTMLLLILTVGCYPHLFALMTAGEIAYEQTLPVLMVAVPIIWTGVIQMPASYYLFTSGRRRYLSISSLLAAFANVALSLLLVKSMGLVGVALGTLIPQLIQHQGSLIRETCRDLNITFSEYVRSVHLKPLLPLLAAALWLVTLQTLLSPIASPLAITGIAGATTLPLALVLWHRFSATPEEKSLIEARILQPLRAKFMSAQPVEVPHA